MKLFVSAALLLAANVSAFAPINGVSSSISKGLHMASTEENCEDRRTFGKVCFYVMINLISMRGVEK